MVQKIFNYDKIQEKLLTPDNVLNILHRQVQHL